MDKYILKDGTEILIEEGSNSCAFNKSFTNLEEYVQTVKSLSKQNLEKYQILSSEVATANLENKECKSHEVTTIWDPSGNITKLIVTFKITDVDMVNERLTALEETTDTLTASLLGVTL